MSSESATTDVSVSSFGEFDQPSENEERQNPGKNVKKSSRSQKKSGKSLRKSGKSLRKSSNLSVKPSASLWKPPGPLVKPLKSSMKPGKSPMKSSTSSLNSASSGNSNKSYLNPNATSKSFSVDVTPSGLSLFSSGSSKPRSKAPWHDSDASITSLIYSTEPPSSCYENTSMKPGYMPPGSLRQQSNDDSSDKDHATAHSSDNHTSQNSSVENLAVYLEMDKTQSNSDLVEKESPKEIKKKEPKKDSTKHLKKKTTRSKRCKNPEKAPAKPSERPKSKRKVKIVEPTGLPDLPTRAIVKQGNYPSTTTPESVKSSTKAKDDGSSPTFPTVRGVTDVNSSVPSTKSTSVNSMSSTEPPKVAAEDLEQCRQVVEILAQNLIDDNLIRETEKMKERINEELKKEKKIVEKMKTYVDQLEEVIDTECHPYLKIKDLDKVRLKLSLLKLRSFKMKLMMEPQSESCMSSDEASAQYVAEVVESISDFVKRIYRFRGKQLETYSASASFNHLLDYAQHVSELAFVLRHELGLDTIQCAGD